MAGNTAAFAAPGGTAQALLDALRARLADILQDLKLQTDVPGEAHRAPRIYDGYLPPKRHKGNTAGEFPFVLVRPGSGADRAEDDASVTLRMVIGVVSEESDGYRDWMAVKERIRWELLQNRVLDGRFSLQYPLIWDLPDEQPFPQWLGTLEATWAIPGLADNTWMGESL